MTCTTREQFIGLPFERGGKTKLNPKKFANMTPLKILTKKLSPQDVLDSLQAKLGLKAVAHFSLVVEHVKSLKRNKLTLLNPRDTLAKVNRSSLFHSNIFVCSNPLQAPFGFFMPDSPLSIFALRFLVQQKAGFSFFLFFTMSVPLFPQTAPQKM